MFIIISVILSIRSSVFTESNMLGNVQPAFKNHHMNNRGVFFYLTVIQVGQYSTVGLKLH